MRLSHLFQPNPRTDTTVPSALSAGDSDPYGQMRKFRKTERAQMIEAIRDLIDEARSRVKPKYTPSNQRAKWMRLAGQLIWYKDQILRSLSYEALEEEVGELKDLVLKKNATETTASGLAQSTPRRTIFKAGDRKGSSGHVRTLGDEGLRARTFGGAHTLPVLGRATNGST